MFLRTEHLTWRRLALALTVLVGVLVVPGVTSAWTVNLVQLDTGACGKNLQTGSDKTASLSATPSFYLMGDGAISKYEMFVDGVSLGIFIGDGSANVCIYATNRLADGGHVLTGNEIWPHSAAITPFSFSVDTVPPAVPSAPVLASYSDSGILGDHISRFRSVAFTGTAEPNVSMGLYNGTAGVGGTKADAYGAWSITTVPLADGSYSLQAGAIDGAGNMSAHSAGTPLTIDATLPTVFVASPAAGASVVGTINVTAAVSDAVGVWKVDFQIDGVTKVTDAAAPFSFAWSSTTVANGVHTIGLIATDLAGNVATSSASVSVVNGVATVPAAPTLAAATAANASVALSWSAPAFDGGSAVTGYKVYRGTSSGGETLLATVGNVNGYTDATAANGTTYFYVVSAVNAMGESTNSNERSATPAVPATAPTAPTLNPATAGNASVSLTWSAPASNGGSAVTSYKLYRGTSSGGETLLTTLGNVLSFTDTTAANGTTYFYVVSALNAVGESVMSNERSATPAAPVTVPGAPVLTSAAAGNASVSLAWSAPASNGGSAITGYKVYRGTTSGGETFLTTVGNVSSYVDATAFNGNTYFYVVSALNAVGEGAKSNERSATPAAPVTVPGAPVLTAAAAGNASVTLAWNAPASNGGSAITGYKIYRGLSSGGETFLTTVGNVASYVDPTAFNGNTYYYVVRAVNSAGEGAKSNELSAKPTLTDTSAPSIPADLRVLLSGTSQLVLNWAPSTDNVGVLGYAVFRDGVFIAGVVQTHFLDSGLAPGSTHVYQVVALDAAMNPSVSDPVAGKTTALFLSAGMTGNVAGVAYNAAGAQLENAIISVRLADGTVRTTKTNASGVWKLSNLATGAYAPTMSLTGYRSQTLALTVLSGQTLLTTTTLAAA